MHAQWLAIAVVILYALIIVALTVYGLNFLYISILAPRLRKLFVECPLPEVLPVVTVQLPIFNERLVAERVIEAAVHLDWPRDRLEIQVLDDSTDDTRDIAARAVAYWRATGVDIHHLHRTQRQGYKAGALAAGLSQARGEFIAIFDADFVPPPDFLRRAIGAFADPQVGYVQGRWDHLNRDASLLTHVQSLGVDAHFMVEQLVRAGRGLVMSFNGTGGVWRRKAIETAGGWSSITLTEDLDLSYRAVLRGWKPFYVPTLPVPAELPPSVSALRRQQARWAQGSAECARRMIPPLVGSRLPLPAKLHGILHLTAYFTQGLMLLICLLYPILLVVHVPHFWAGFLSMLGMMVLPVSLAPVLFVLTAQRLLRPATWWREIPFLFGLWLLGAGLIVNNSRALWRGLTGRPTVFERTPKWGQVGGRARRRPTPYRVRADWIVAAEIILAGLNAATAFLAWDWHNGGIVLSALLFAAGLAIVSLMSAWEVISSRRAAVDV